jgi:aerotaxis receptor
MDLADIVGEAVEHVLTYTGGNTRRVYVTPIETPTPREADRLAHRHPGHHDPVQPVFCDMSGYGEAELIGQPHCLLRHPDMPAAAFRDLWETVQAGRQWHGYVKNLRKDGGHYWVYATVVPNVRDGKIVGFTSVRREPSREKVAAAEAQYQEMRGS